MQLIAGEPDVEKMQIPRRYIEAAIIGCVIGFAAIFSQGFFWDGIGSGGWEIPLWNRIDRFDSPHALDLEIRALWLRTCIDFINHGFWYLAAPIAGMCGLIKLTEVAANRPILRIFSRTAWVWVWLSLFIACIGYMTGTLTALRSHSFFEAFYNCWEGMLSLLFIFQLFSITPTIVFLYFLVQVAKYLRSHWEHERSRDLN